MLIRDMSRSLADHGKKLLLADLTSQIMVDWMAVLEDSDPRDGCFTERRHGHRALRGSAHQPRPTRRPSTTETEIPLSAMDIFRQLTPEQVARLAPYLERASYPAGERIIKEGDAADRLYLLASGQRRTSPFFSTTARQTRGSAAFRPGVAFGEFALFDGGRRVANVVAETAATCYVLQFANLKQLEKTEPELFYLILFALGRLLSDRLRRVTAEVESTVLTFQSS